MALIRKTGARFGAPQVGTRGGVNKMAHISDMDEKKTESAEGHGQLDKEKYPYLFAESLRPRRRFTKIIPKGSAFPAGKGPSREQRLARMEHAAQGRAIQKRRRRFGAGRVPGGMNKPYPRP